MGETYWPEPDERLGGGTFRTSDLVELRAGLDGETGRVKLRQDTQLREAGAVVRQQGLADVKTRKLFPFSSTTFLPRAPEAPPQLSHPARLR